MISHCIFPTWVLVIVMNACPEKGRMSWFNDLECRLMPQPSFATFLAAYMGYFAYDSVIKIKLFLLDKEKHKHEIIHHVCAATGYITSSLAGYGQPGCGLMLTTISFTSIFLCAKEVIPKDYKTIDMINKFTFYIAFTIVRMIGCPFLWYWCGFEVLAGWQARTGPQNFCAICVFIVGTLLILLNFLWYFIMTKILIAICRGEKNETADDA